MAGTLFVVATPIGNLEDLTFRALRTLKEVQLIAAEDTRRTAKLLAHYEIRCPLVSLREHNEVRETPRLLDRLTGGEDIALVSDAGTPGISDPGARLVRAAHERHLRVVPIPGPSAVAAALSVSGFPADRFVFMGFPPSSGHERQQWFSDVAAEEKTVVFFESPHRIQRTLADVSRLVNRPIIVARELTKLHEQLVVTPNTAIDQRGEFAVVISQPAEHNRDNGLDPAGTTQAIALFYYLTDSLLFATDRAARVVAEVFAVPLSVIRQALKRDRYARAKPDDTGEP